MANVGTERLPELLMATFGDQMTIDVAQGRKMTVRIVDAVVGAALVGGHQFVRAGLRGALALPDSGAHVLERDLGAVVRHGRDR